MLGTEDMIRDNYITTFGHEPYPNSLTGVDRSLYADPVKAMMNLPTILESMHAVELSAKALEDAGSVSSKFSELLHAWEVGAKVSFRVDPPTDRDNLLIMDIIASLNYGAELTTNYDIVKLDDGYEVILHHNYRYP